MSEALFEALFDDAAIFPPGNAPLPEAVRAHRTWRRSPAAGLVGPFIASADRADDLAGEEDLSVSLTVPEGPSGLDAALVSRGFEVVSVEVPIAGGGWEQLLDAATRTVVYVEVRLPDLTPGLAQRLSAAGLRLKMRTGGTQADKFPTAAALARGIVTAVTADLSFKLTAGLHHALRHRDLETGFEHHGFGNVLAATATALSGAGGAQVADVLESTDKPMIADRLCAPSDEDAADLRRTFRSFGTCSIAEPVDELIDLCLLPDHYRNGVTQ